MKPMIACCGLRCDTCPIHVATLEEDKARQVEMRRSIAELCRTQYGMNIELSQITDCDGCRAGTGRLFSGCLNCEIRKCAMGKGIENCSSCESYACERLLEFFAHELGARRQLDNLRGHEGHNGHRDIKINTIRGK